MREIPEHKGECEMLGSALWARISAARNNLEVLAVPLLCRMRKTHTAGFVELEILERRVARAQCFLKDDASMAILQFDGLWENPWALGTIW